MADRARVEAIWHLAQRVSETHSCIAGVLYHNTQHVSTVAVLADEKQIPSTTDLGGRQVLVDPAITALHFG
jgi:hypothetical protein